MIRALLLALPMLPVAVYADGDSERAYHALQRGDIRPLAEILATVGLDGEDGRWIYEFEVITAHGGLTEVYVDATTNAILKTEDDD